MKEYGGMFVLINGARCVEGLYNQVDGGQAVSEDSDGGAGG